MTSKFFRFLKRDQNSSRNNTGHNVNNIPSGSLSSSNCSSNQSSTVATSSASFNHHGKHVKLDGCEDLKESIDHYNQRCQALRELRVDKQHSQTESSNRFSLFKSFKNVGSRATDAGERRGAAVYGKDMIECAVFFLDDTQQSFYMPKKSLAGKLYELVHAHLDLLETDYFGLQFSDTHNVKHWLEPGKPIKKQCKIGPPYQFFFRVKFYTAEPNNLSEELTRYFYFLQLKKDLRSGLLCCSTHEPICAELCALILQEELGDYDPDHHSVEMVSEFRFLPDNQQTEQFEEQIFEKYINNAAYRGLTPAEAELAFLNKAKWLEMYGVDMHSVYGRDQNEYKLGLTPSGILVFEECAPPLSGNMSDLAVVNNKIGLFYWPKIEKVMFSKRKFTILVGEDDARTGCKQEHTFIFHLIDEKACKHLWKCAVEYHAFFRLRTSPKYLASNSGSGGAGAGANGNLFNGFIRRGSRFKGPERTEFQTLTMQRLSANRRSVQFERKPSQRFSKRSSYAARRRAPQEAPTSNSLAPQAVPRSSGFNNQSQTSTLNDLKQNNINSKAVVTVKNTPPSSVVAPIQTCCRLNQTTKGLEHDLKCNLFKAQLMQQQMSIGVVSQRKESGCSSSSSSSSSGVVLPSSSSSTTSSSCEQKTIENDSADEINIDTRPCTRNRNLYDDNLMIHTNSKLTNKDTSTLLAPSNQLGSSIASLSNNHHYHAIPNRAYNRESHLINSDVKTKSSVCPVTTEI